MGASGYVGQVLEGRYRVERLLGSGGMGAVYEGRHVVVGKRVAIKILHAEYARHAEVLRRFYREAQAAAAIGHKNIIDIMDVGVTSQEEPYLVMEHLEGEDLQSMLERTGPLPLDAVCGILEPALQALGAAHGKGIVHRDLKPANIFLARGEGGPPTVKLIDFGISKITGSGGTKLTRTGSLMGTPAYMSPEQARGDGTVDHRSDIYSMGVILFQMLTGELPFQGEHYNALLINLLTQEPPRPRTLNPAIPADAEALVLKELSKDPAARSQSAAEMLAALSRLGAFEERDSGLSLLGTHLRGGVASGDLGVGEEREDSSAVSVLSEMARGTPGGWTRTGKREGRTRPLVAALAIAAALAVAALAAILLARSGKTPHVNNVVPAAPPAASAPSPAEDTGVSVTVRGAPPGARILYDGAEVPRNPFRVKRASTLSQVRVEAGGFEPFVSSVIPEKDTVVDVRMVAVAAEAPAKPAPAAGARHRPKKAGAGAAGEAGKAEDGRISKEKRGTLLTDSFE